MLNSQFAIKWVLSFKDSSQGRLGSQTSIAAIAFIGHDFQCFFGEPFKFFCLLNPELACLITISYFEPFFVLSVLQCELYSMLYFFSLCLFSNIILSFFDTIIYCSFFHLIFILSLDYIAYGKKHFVNSDPFIAPPSWVERHTHSSFFESIFSTTQLSHNIWLSSLIVS